MSSVHLLLLLSKKTKQNYCFVFWVIYYSLQLEHQVSSLSKRQHKPVGYIFLLRKTSWSPRQWMVVPSKLRIWHKWVTREDPQAPSSLFYPMCTAQEPGHWCCRNGRVPALGRGTGSTSMGRQTPGHWRASCPCGWSCCAQSMTMDMALSLPSFK